MRIASIFRTSGVMIVAAGLVSVCIGAGRDGTPDSSTTAQQPELRPGEIVIKKTGRTRVTRVATTSAAPATQPAAEPSYDGPGPRNVTIGYFYRDELETGWGPQIFGSYYDYGGYGCGYGVGSYGGYGYNYGSSCFSRSYGYSSSSYCYPSYRRGSSFSGSHSSFHSASSPVTYTHLAKH
jgi:hypothetical protein